MHDRDVDPFHRQIQEDGRARGSNRRQHLARCLVQQQPAGGGPVVKAIFRRARPYRTVRLIAMFPCAVRAIRFIVAP
jgi:hypothetical protein